MKWQGRRQSSNVEDRRSMGGPRMAVGGGAGLLILVVIVILLGGNPQALLQGLPQGPGGPAGGGGPVASTPEDEARAEFVSVVLADTEDVWRELFASRGDAYVEPSLVLFRDGVRSGCGMAGSEVGPFYCPADSKVYIDLGFFDELAGRFDAPGDFAQAYVIAHEVGHHVQHLMGITEQVERQRGRLSEAEMNELSVRLELQADFLAGVWAHHAQRTKGILEPGDIEEGLGAASAVGDDTIQRRTQGRVVPDSFTHGTAEQRVRWFRRGFQTGDLDQGDTFAVDRP